MTILGTEQLMIDFTFLEDTQGYRTKSDRPHPNFSTENKLEEVESVIQAFVNRLRGEEGVLGVTYGGGISRGFGDDHSDIDLHIYLTKEAYQQWLQGKGPIPHKDFTFAGRHFDSLFICYPQENLNHLPLVAKWDRSYQKILIDPYGKVTERLVEGDKFSKNEKIDSFLDDTIHAFWLGDMFVSQCLKRQDYLTAHFSINMAVEHLCRLLFLINDEIPAFKKHLVHYSLTLPWKPADWAQKIEELLLVKEFSSDEVVRRHNLFKALYSTIWGKVVGEEWLTLTMRELQRFEELMFIINNEPTMKEFGTLFPLADLSLEPLFSLLNRETIGGEEKLRFNWAKFEEEKGNEFEDHLTWNQELLRNLWKASRFTHPT